MKFGVIGYGSIGFRHAANLQQLGHEVMVYDPLTRRDVNRETGIYDSNVDAVVIATPTPYHEGPLRACVERGKHIFVEKPLSTSTGMLPALLKAASDKNLVVMMGNNLRFHACIHQAAFWIRDGMIGDVIWAHFTCAQLNEKYTESVVLNWGAHEVDVAMHLFGPVDQVLCASSDDMIADFVLWHRNGIRSSFHLDYVTPVEIREAWIIGKRNNIGLDLVNRRASLGKWAQQLPGSFDEDYRSEMRAFVERIEGRTTPGATGEDGLEVLKVLLEVRKKAGLI